MKLIVFGLSVTSSWGNGHATTYRALLREFVALGHEVLFLERNQPWYAAHRDLKQAPYRIEIYETLFDVQQRFGDEIASADAVIIGSYVPEGIALAEWVLSTAQGLRAFYDIDTPVTIAALESGSCAYLTPGLIEAFDLYLSFCGGPLLDRLHRGHGARNVAPLHCSADPERYFLETTPPRWSMGYLGTYSEDRQSALERLLLEPARRLSDQTFAVAGPLYPPEINWPENVTRIEHLGPDAHRAFYAQQRFTLSVTRGAMVSAGYSPSVRLFEAAACAVPVITDRWDGIENFFEPESEILIADSTDEILSILRDTSPDESAAIGLRARERVLREHTAAHRAAELERLLQATAKPAREVAL